jgi:hypothetical protein
MTMGAGHDEADRHNKGPVMAAVTRGCAGGAVAERFPRLITPFPLGADFVARRTLQPSWKPRSDKRPGIARSVIPAAARISYWRQPESVNTELSLESRFADCLFIQKPCRRK